MKLSEIEGWSVQKRKEMLNDPAKFEKYYAQVSASLHVS